MTEKEFIEELETLINSALEDIPMGRIKEALNDEVEIFQKFLTNRGSLQ